MGTEPTLEYPSCCDHYKVSGSQGYEVVNTKTIMIILSINVSWLHVSMCFDYYSEQKDVTSVCSLLDCNISGSPLLGTKPGAKSNVKPVFAPRKLDAKLTPRPAAKKPPKRVDLVNFRGVLVPTEVQFYH